MEKFNSAKSLANASQTRVMKLASDIALKKAEISKLKVDREEAKEERCSAASAAKTRKDDLNLAEEESKVAEAAQEDFHEFVTVVNHWGLGNERVIVF